MKHFLKAAFVDETCGNMYVFYLHERKEILPCGVFVFSLEIFEEIGLWHIFFVKTICVCPNLGKLQCTIP
jgi:hypothetical protein